MIEIPLLKYHCKRLLTEFVNGFLRFDLEGLILGRLQMCVTMMSPQVANYMLHSHYKNFHLTTSRVVQSRRLLTRVLGMVVVGLSC